METVGKRRALRVLSIDGGGMRGIYAATYLHSLSGGIKKRRQLSHELDIGKAFDLIVGGLSMVKNFRTSFSQEISETSLDALIRRLASTNAEPDTAT